MTIALAHYSSVADISGVTSWFEKFVLRLARDGYEPAVHLHHFGPRPADASVLPRLLDAGVRVESVARGHSLQDDVEQTLRFLDEVRPSVFLPQCLTAHYLAASLAGQRGLPWVFTIHSDDPDYWAQAEEVKPWERNGRTVCVSKHIASLVREKNMDPQPVVIPYGVDASEKSASLSDAGFRVAYIGRIVERQKRMSLVMESLIQACRLNPRIEAVIIGDGPELERFKQQVVRARLQARIIFTGRVPPREVAKNLATVQACLLMSDYEGLPVALLEAMSMGIVPVVRVSDSGIPELVRHEETGLLVDDVPRNCALALSRLADDRRLWSHCSRQARALVTEQYSEESSYSRWTEMIDGLRTGASAAFPLAIETSSGLDLVNRGLLQGYASARPMWRRVAGRVRARLLGS